MHYNIAPEKRQIKIIENLTKGLQVYFKKYKIIITKDLNNITFNYNKNKIKIKKEIYNKVIIEKSLVDLANFILNKFNIKKQKSDLSNLNLFISELFNIDDINYVDKNNKKIEKSFYDTINTIAFKQKLLNKEIEYKQEVYYLLFNNKKISLYFLDNIINKFNLKFATDFFIYNKNRKEIIEYLINNLKEKFEVNKINKNEYKISLYSNSKIFSSNELLEVAINKSLTFLHSYVQSEIFKIKS